jgi:hypothetical protein
MDRNSEEFKQLIEIPLGQLFNVKGALDVYKGVASDTASAIASPAGAGAVVGAAAIIYGSYKLYKDYISKAGSYCRKKVPQPQRSRCELEFHIRAKKAQVKNILNGHHKCKDQGCYQKLDNKANQLKREIDTLNAKLSKSSPPQPERRTDEVSRGESEKSK